jgi:hypothetical protein
MLPVRHPNCVPRWYESQYVGISFALYDYLMNKYSKKVISRAEIPAGKVKAILKGGTFNRIQVLLDPRSTTIEHCGLNYKVTHQKDAKGRVVCLWSQY